MATIPQVSSDSEAAFCAHELTRVGTREFVKKTFAACTEGNRPAVELELKEKIKQAHDTNRIWQINWETVQLKSCVHLICPVETDP